MDIYDAFMNDMDCAPTDEPVIPGIYNVNYTVGHETGTTQFRLYPGDTLSELGWIWLEFAEKNKWDPYNVDNVSVSYEKPDEDMQCEIDDILTWGIVIPSTSPDNKNTYITPEHVKIINDAIEKLHKERNRV